MKLPAIINDITQHKIMFLDHAGKAVLIIDCDKRRIETPEGVDVSDVDAVLDTLQRLTAQR